MIVDDISFLMKKIESFTLDLGDAITSDDYYIEDMRCPHKQPHQLPKGYAAIYIFVYENEYLKIGKANAKSRARFVSQHYGFNAKSTLAKSICLDKVFEEKGVMPDTVKNWMLNNLHRINIYVKESCGKKATEFIESVMHYVFRPKYEGNI